MELIAGEVVVIAPSGGSAALAQTEIVHQLRAWQGGSGGRLLSDVFVRVGENYLAPDVAWWRAGHEPRIVAGAIATVPDVVIEVLSPATRENDLGPKRDQYLTAGVDELWLVDPAERRVVIVDATGDRRFGADDLITSPRLPGFELRAASLFT